VSAPCHFPPPGPSGKRKGGSLNAPGHVGFVSADMISRDGPLDLPCRLHVLQLVADGFEAGLVDICDQLLVDCIMRDEFIGFGVQPHLAVVMRQTCAARGFDDGDDAHHSGVLATP